MKERKLVFRIGFMDDLIRLLFSVVTFPQVAADLRVNPPLLFVIAVVLYLLSCNQKDPPLIVSHLFRQLKWNLLTFIKLKH